MASQTVLFIEALALGFVLGFCMEPLRICRLMLRPGAVSVFFQDIIYWFFCSVCSFVFILTVNSGQLRIFLIIGIVLGMVIYFLTLGALIMRASKAIVAFIRRVFRFVDRKIARPIAGVYDKTKQNVVKSANKLRVYHKKIQNNVNYRLKHNRILLYNLIHTKRSRDDAQKSGNRGHLGYESKRKNKQKNAANH